ncbi:MAG: type I DNA topoisomerase, partial [Rectinemataceae bacterium]
MATKSTGSVAATKGRPLVIVESPAKARTIAKFLGQDWMVEASIGHVRDLPSSAAEIPAALKGEAWARLGVEVDRDYAALYVVPPEKRARIRELKARLKEASMLYLATDEDREGESISWHLLELLQPKVPVKRMVFHEITKSAIKEAIDNCRDLDEHLVDAQEARRILDRLYGYEVSPVLWRKIAPRLSAGRVQSVTTRIIVDRERERMAFRRAGWWDARIMMEEGGQRFPAKVLAFDGKVLATGRDFTSTGTLSGGRKVLVLDEKAAASLAAGLSGRTAKVRSVEEREFSSSPKAPFTTSTLQQEAGRRLGMSAKRAMQAAQRLYESGFITYMRTDSVKLSGQAIEAARSLIASRYGKEYLPANPRNWEGKSRNAQEAHEAIRPAGENFRDPSEVAAEVDSQDARLYELIWKRTLASQMPDARHKAVVATFDCALGAPVLGGKAELQARGKTVLFEGFLKAWAAVVADTPEDQAEDVKEGEEAGADSADSADRDAILPPLRAGMEARVAEAQASGHETQSPARYTEAGIVQKLEELGIGRPSTYASIIATIIDREYVAKRGSALVPTPLAFAVVQLMLELEPALVDYDFTAGMESRLDEIALGGLGRVAFLDEFYRGTKPGLHAIVNERATSVDPKRVCTIPLGEHEGMAISLRVGRYGPYLERGEARASVPEGLAPDEITIAKALELLAAAGRSEEPLGAAPDGTPVYLRVGRFGPYVQLGEDPKDKKSKIKPKRSSLFKSMNPKHVALKEALLLLSLPRSLGAAPDGGAIIARPGRFGPYLEKVLPGVEKPETRSLKSEEQLLTITLAEALALFAIPKGTRGRAASATLRELGSDPATGEAMLVKDGRYGPYVTDGTTNATVPKGSDPALLTQADGARMLAERREAGPAKGRQSPTSKSRSAGRAGAAPKAAPPKAAAKATAKGKPANEAVTTTVAAKPAAKPAATSAAATSAAAKAAAA